eukprot:m.115719 g.115719  ORF g.115719 m.115719 type:complete len:86 (+) comp12844_c0_seq2:114-371(+)
MYKLNVLFDCCRFRIKSKLRQKLQNSQEWRDAIRQRAQTTIQDNGDITVEQLVAVLAPFARGEIPQEARDELLQDIRKALADQTQ